MARQTHTDNRTIYMCVYVYRRTAHIHAHILYTTGSRIVCIKEFSQFSWLLLMMFSLGFHFSSVIQSQQHTHTHTAAQRLLSVHPCILHPAPSLVNISVLCSPGNVLNSNRVRLQPSVVSDTSNCKDVPNRRNIKPNPNALNNSKLKCCKLTNYYK